jgi:hypothetical protein
MFLQSCIENPVEIYRKLNTVIISSFLHVNKLPGANPTTSKFTTTTPVL